MSFKRGDKVKLNIPMYNRCAGSLLFGLRTGIWKWPPKVGYIEKWIDHLAAREIVPLDETIYKIKTWYVDEQYIKLY